MSDLRYKVDRLADGVNRPRTNRDQLESVVNNLIRLISDVELSPEDVEGVRAILDDIRADISMNHPLMNQEEVDELISTVENAMLVAEL